MITKKSDDAISPVIGVMLMLVVTVVIAAAVTIFATGVVGETEAAPVATLDVEILSSTASLIGLKGPELFITHLSGEPVDTDDIELRFSWTHDGCSHYSTFSAKGFKEKEEYKNGLNTRKQPLYVKSTMPVQKENPEYGSTGLDHYFGDVILTPGMKLTATSDFLDGATNTESEFMNVVFDNYNSKIEVAPDPEIYYSSHGYGENPNCEYCKKWGTQCYIADAIDGGYTLNDGDCAYCAVNGWTGVHKASECTIDCVCADGSTKKSGIMKHLQPGTAVDVMIVHTPSGKAIYDKTVIVQ
ncbi:MAG TPA: type IV pilin N-terminal domain-containing protein [Methanocorpusculum sp.]|jgi:FlaG/FlaF family flagellin (archaellin)|nr:type IV pilin N-terminal domain-containing protein [Methanocorpusculum sp.]HJJ73789.1 type IV pilin N-terminal domain-containing protein [Methanocorpusculum sp.]